MAQLSDDCFAFGGTLTPIDDALEAIASRLESLAEIERVPLKDALHRALAETVTASRSVPPLPNSAVDGYAVRHCDLKPVGDTVMSLQGRVAAGHPLEALPPPGHAVRIFTGAPMPEGFDTVFMQEDVKLGSDGKIILPAGLKRGANARDAGEDVLMGQALLDMGKRLSPADLGLLASQGFTEIAVRTPLRVAILSTGDELAEPGDTAMPGQLFDSNRTMLSALTRSIGAEVTDLGIIPDDPSRIERTLIQAAKTHHVILSSGGMSTGEEDHLTDCLKKVGSVHFWRLAIKPGRPVGLGQIGNAVVVGLPGNPAAAAVCFAALTRPLLARLGGLRLPDPKRYLVESAFSYKKKPQRREYVRVRLVDRPGDLPLAEKYPKEGAGILTSIAESDGFVILSEDTTQVIEGDTVAFLPFDALGLS